ncbi:hypothetical protein QBC42DRAFT_258200 [Cladorrhinum samala]|uniref:Uncharacterized protein n=1 Tax=Cladorrhinum samala TaxID=585594 RepID=A0AAV9I4W1_9PEZI|nr:hypothetical protein QBC42DRAFT_258200 [Cladorrhinum samala]
MSADSEQNPTAQIVRAPSRPTITGKKSIFLAGTTTPTDGPDWRDILISAISHLPVTVFEPTRSDWDSTWEEDIKCPKFREQVEWELDMQERSDVVVIYFGPNTKAPISLLELGLVARSGKAIIGYHKQYEKRGNLQVVALKFGIKIAEVDGNYDKLLELVTKTTNEQLALQH